MKKKVCYLLTTLMSMSLCFGCGKADPVVDIDTSTEESVITSTDETTESETTTINEISENQTTTEEETTTEAPTTTVQQTTTIKETTTKKQEVTTKEQETTTQKLEPSVIVSSNNITITDDQPVAVTIEYKNFPGSYYATVYQSDTSIVSSSWSEWYDGNRITLYIYGQSNGSATVTVYSNTYGMDYANTTINVTVNKPTPASQSSLTIDSVGGEYKYWGNAMTYNLNKLNSAEYEIRSRKDGNINIYVDITTSCIEYNCIGFGWIYYSCKLCNSSGVVVDTDFVLIDFSNLNELYADSLIFDDLEPDDYTLIFYDQYK